MIPVAFARHICPCGIAHALYWSYGWILWPGQPAPRILASAVLRSLLCGRAQTSRLERKSYSFSSKIRRFVSWRSLPAGVSRRRRPSPGQTETTATPPNARKGISAASADWWALECGSMGTGCNVEWAYTEWLLRSRRIWQAGPHLSASPAPPNVWSTQPLLNRPVKYSILDSSTQFRLRKCIARSLESIAGLTSLRFLPFERQRYMFIVSGTAVLSSIKTIPLTEYTVALSIMRRKRESAVASIVERSWRIWRKYGAPIRSPFAKYIKYMLLTIVDETWPLQSSERKLGSRTERTLQPLKNG